MDRAGGVFIPERTASTVAIGAYSDNPLKLVHALEVFDRAGLACSQLARSDEDMSRCSTEDNRTILSQSDILESDW